MMGAIPRQIKTCDEHNIKPIFGIELYVNPYQTKKDDFEYIKKQVDPKLLRKSYHLLALAYTNQGYKNLVRLSSWGWIEGLYYKPRVNHEQLMTYKEGIIFTSCCYLGEIGQAFDTGGEEAAFKMLEKYIGMFAPNFYLELMLLDFKKQKPYDAFLIKAHDKYGIPLIVTQDCHYAEKEDSKYQRLMLMVNQKSTIQEIEKKLAEGKSEEEFFELQDTNLWMKSEEELNEKWASDYSNIIDYDLFKSAKQNTVKICEKVNVEIDRSIKLPDIKDADEKLKDALLKGFDKRGISKNDIKYIKRMEEELDLIKRKGFSSYFLIQKEMTDEARRICPEKLGWGNGKEAVGAGRGCLHPDTRIVMADGTTKKICDVQIGDLVITIDGTAKRVLNVFSFDVLAEERLVNLLTYFDDLDGLRLTKDHLVYAMRNQGDKLEWIPAGKLYMRDWLFIPKPKEFDDDMFRKPPRKKYLFGGRDNMDRARFTLWGKGYVSRIGYNQPNRFPWGIYLPGFKNRSFKRLEDGNLLVRIRRTRRRKYGSIEQVYDLEIEKNHNFLTTCGLVHNSAVGALTCYLLGITDVDPVKRDLLFSRFLSEARGGKQIKLKFKNVFPVPLEEFEND